MRVSWIVVIATASASVLGLLATEAAQRGQRISPHESVSATVDGAELSITYGRPSMRGRTIMGGLVPYGRVWCPGADEATTLTTSRPLQLGTLSLTANSYTLWMLPAADVWKLIVNRQVGQFHTQYDAQHDLGRLDLQKQVLATPVERLTFAIEKNPAGAGGVIKMTWETTEVSAPFTVVQ